MHFTIMSVLRNCLLFYKFSTSPWLKTSVHSLSAVPSSNATLFFEWFFLVSTIKFYMSIR